MSNIKHIDTNSWHWKWYRAMHTSSFDDRELFDRQFNYGPTMTYKEYISRMVSGTLLYGVTALIVVVMVSTLLFLAMYDTQYQIEFWQSVTLTIVLVPLFWVVKIAIVKLYKLLKNLYSLMKRTVYLCVPNKLKDELERIVWLKND